EERQCCTTVMQSAQVTRAQVGDSVLLPCNYKTNPLPETTSVFWRDSNSSVVLDIIKKKPDHKTQNEKYKGRVFSFQNVYNEGNFSILMKDVRLTDSSSYECLVLEVNHLQILKLTVSVGYKTLHQRVCSDDDVHITCNTSCVRSSWRQQPVSSNTAPTKTDI
uniref:Ig-like domain-containing protein n=1 Tax=Labrus bergylta TaxID=56723 RepID=A0A3Q3EEB8_9LABR